MNHRMVEATFTIEDKKKKKIPRNDKTDDDIGTVDL